MIEPAGAVAFVVVTGAVVAASVVVAGAVVAASVVVVSTSPLITSVAGTILASNASVLLGPNVNLLSLNSYSPGVASAATLNVYSITGEASSSLIGAPLSCMQFTYS